MAARTSGCRQGCSHGDNMRLSGQGRGKRFILGLGLLAWAAMIPLFLPVTAGTPLAKAAAAPSILSLYRLIPKEGLPVVGEVSSGTKRLLAVIPFELRPGLTEDTPILSVEAKLISKLDGRETPLEAEIREHMTYEGSADILLVDLILADITPGAYELEISVEDMGTDRRSAVRKSLILR